MFFSDADAKPKSTSYIWKDRRPGALILLYPPHPSFEHQEPIEESWDSIQRVNHEYKDIRTRLGGSPTLHQRTKEGRTHPSRTFNLIARQP